MEYYTVRNFNVDNEIKKLASLIKDMTVNDIYEGDKLENNIHKFYTNNIHGEYKNEIYRVRKQNDHVEYNNASFILFDGEDSIKSVYVRNIISFTIDGIKYTRKQ